MSLIERLAMRLKRLRKARKKMTQVQLAERAGLKRSLVARLETGRYDPKLSTLQKLAKALKVPVAELLK